MEREHPIDLPERPLVAPWYRIVQEEARILLEHAQRVVCLEGRAATHFIPALLPLLDGTRTHRDVVAELGEGTGPAVERTLRILHGHGVLVEGGGEATGKARPAEAFVASLGESASRRAEAQRAVRASGLAVLGHGPLADEVVRQVEAAGLRVERTQELRAGTDLTLVAPAPDELPLLPAWNRAALEDGARWLQILPFDGRFGVVGPLYLPGETLCHECFRTRRAAHLEYWQEIAAIESRPLRSPSVGALDAVLAGLGVLLALRWLALSDHYVPSAFYCLELAPTLSLTLHHVYRVPRCKACSGLEEIAPPLPWFKETARAGG